MVARHKIKFGEESVFCVQIGKDFFGGRKWLWRSDTVFVQRCHVIDEPNFVRVTLGDKESS